MQYSFSARGHKNISLKHKTTLEFTKESILTKEGDCIAGVLADFDVKDLRRFARCKSLRITISLGSFSETIECTPNQLFDDLHELVIRKGDFASKRTFGTRANKAAIDLGRQFAVALKDPSAQMVVKISDE
jgi:uncharacterized protein